MNTKPDIAALRKEYKQASLDLGDLEAKPVQQFERWFEHAQQGGVPEPTAMHLATADARGRPAGRMVLLKGLDADGGLHFFTNYQSRKGRHLSENPHAALTFFWPELERQVRIEGLVERLSAEASDTYYHSRPEGSRIGAWASPQSEVLPDRQALQALLDKAMAQFPDGKPTERPPFWGGYRLRPVLWEFWQGRESRLHDRFLYELNDDGQWAIVRLAP